MNIGLFTINTDQQYREFSELTGYTLLEDTLYLGQVQDGKIYACMSVGNPGDGGFLIDQDESFACTPKNGAKLWIKTVAKANTTINLAN